MTLQPAHAAPSSDTLSVLAELDPVATKLVLVFGSLPPQGRDLDLLVDEVDAPPIAAHLADAGFEYLRGRWVRFSACTACAVELVEAGSWGLPPAELAALFSDAAPLAGLERIVEPAPPHALLILARKLAGSRRLPDRKRARVESLLERDPSAWESAREAAAGWDAVSALGHLRRLHENGDQLPRWLRRPRRTRIVTLSGVDGSGKSSQAGLLQVALDRLGHDAVIEWSPAHSISLNVVAEPIRRMFGYGSLSTGEADRDNPDFRPSDYPAVVVHTWTTLAALSTALSLWRSVWRHLGRGRVVICDRFALDFAVFFAYRHGGDRSLRFQRWLLRTAAPRTRAAFFLDVPPEAALARKEDQYSLPELRRQSDLYRSFSSAFKVRRLDGEASLESLSREIQLDVWRKLERLE